MHGLCTTDLHLEGLRDGLRELCAKWTVARRHYCCDCDCLSRRRASRLRRLTGGSSDTTGEMLRQIAHNRDIRKQIAENPMDLL